MDVRASSLGLSGEEKLPVINLKIDDPMYRDILLRLDGENWDTEGIARNKVIVNIVDDFEGWDAWKENNKKGYDCTVSFKIDGDKIITTTENFGISLKNITTVLQAPPEMYVCLTGDQVAITNIKIINPES